MTTKDIEERILTPYQRRQKRIELARQQRGVWKNKKSGALVTIIAVDNSRFQLAHQSGLRTWQQDHYFVDAFEPHGTSFIKLAAIEIAESLPGLNHSDKSINPEGELVLRIEAILEKHFRV